MYRSEKWTRDRVRDAALKCRTKTEFQERFSGAKKWALRKGIYEEVCAHMERQFFWTLPLVQDEAKKYSSKSEFGDGCSSAYQWACRNGVINDLFDDRLTAWDLESVRQEALKYSSREEFRKHGAGASQWAERNGVWSDVCSHMKFLNKRVTFEEASKVAKTFSSRAEFYRKGTRCYAAAMRNGWLDEICNHMEPGKPNSLSDIVYLWNVKGEPNVYKIGVTSTTLGKHRIQRVAAFAGVKVGNVLMKYCKKARDVERKLLSIGKPHDFGFAFNGSTEFRTYTPEEFDKCIGILGKLEDVTA